MLLRVLLQDGVKDLASNTHAFLSSLSCYSLQRAIRFPFDQTHNTVFGDNWRKGVDTAGTTLKVLSGTDASNGKLFQPKKP